MASYVSRYARDSAEVTFAFFFDDTTTTEDYTLSLHDALPISAALKSSPPWTMGATRCAWRLRSEEHTSELQSRLHLVCRLLLEKKNSEASKRRDAPAKMPVTDYQQWKSGFSN